MYTLDANIFNRILAANQPDHATCQALLVQLRGRALPIIVPRIVFAEIAAGVRAMTNDAMRARMFVAMWRADSLIQVLPLDETLDRAASDLAADEGLRGMDAIYVAVAQRHGCRFVTLDTDARRRAARVVPALTPAEALAGLL